MVIPKSPSGCPMDALLRLLMGPWTTYILYVLRANGPTRFGELKRKVAGVSAKVLTERLRMLEQADVILRHYEPTIPPQVTYELAPREIRVNAVSAGPVKTISAMGVGGFSGFLAAYRDRAPLRRTVESSEVGEAAAFLLSDAARGITGEVLMVDGGYSISGV